MNKYEIDYEYTTTGKIQVIASNETEAEDMAFEVFDKDEIVAPMITKVVELD